MLEGPAHSKNKKLYIFLATAQTLRMQPILVSYEALLGAISQKHGPQWTIVIENINFIFCYAQAL